MRKILWGILLLSLFSCRKDKTSWESGWSVPLVSDTLTLNNLVRDSILQTNNSGYYQLGINRNVLDLTLNDNLKIPDTTVVQQYAISGSLHVPPGFSFIANVKDHEFKIKDALLRKIRLSSGVIELKIENPFATKTIFTVRLPKVTKNGQSISKVFYAEAGTRANPYVLTESIDISGYELDLSGTGGGDYNKLQSEMEVSSDPQGTAITVSSLDITRFSAKLHSIKLDYARGYFGKQVIEETETIHVSFLDKIVGGAIDIQNTDLRFIVYNGIKAMGRATLKSLENYNGRTGTAVQLSHPQIGNPMLIEGATGTESTLSASVRSIDFTATNSNIEPFIKNLGSKINLKYKIELNPYGNISTGWDEFFPKSKLQVRLKGNMPLNIGMNQLTLQDTFKLEFKNDPSKTSISEGKLKLKADNAFPLEGTVKLSLLDAAGNIIETITGSQSIRSSVFGQPASSGELQKMSSVVEFVLSRETLASMHKVKNVIVNIALNTPDANNASQIVTIPEGAFLSVKLNSSFQLATKL